MLLGLLDAVAFLLVAVSLLTREFLPDRRKPLLLAGLGVSIFTFAVMAFANNMVTSYDTVRVAVQLLHRHRDRHRARPAHAALRGREWLSRITHS